MAGKDDRVLDILHKAVTEFINREGNRRSIITVTRLKLSDDWKHAVAFFTVLPETAQDEALSFLKRRGTDVRTFVKEHTSLRRLPFFDFEIDKGELARQRVDALLRENRD